MDVLESGNGVVRLAEVPHVEARVLVIVVSYYELGGKFWVPHHAGSLSLHRGLLLGWLAEIGLVRRRLGLCELEDGLGGHEIPDDNFSVFTCTGENVRHNSVPADCRDVAAFVEVGLTWLELDWLFQVLGNVLDEDFGAATGEQVFLVWIELKGLDGDALVDLGGGDATLAHQLLVFALSQDLLHVPEGDRAIFHTACDDAKLIDLIDPVESGKLSGTFSHSKHF